MRVREYLSMEGRDVINSVPIGCINAEGSVFDHISYGGLRAGHPWKLAVARAECGGPLSPYFGANEPGPK